MFLKPRKVCTVSPPLLARRISMQSSSSRSVAERKVVQELVKKLRQDLLQQYERPFDMDFSIYTPDLLFTDPMTQLRSRFLYRGMLVSIAAICWTMFRPGTVSFDLDACEFVEADDPESPGFIRTEFRTSGMTKWAPPDTPPFVISGIDKFHLVEGKVPGTFQISHHESTWDQTPQEVTDEFLRRR